jgi:hypothetical protein
MGTAVLHHPPQKNGLNVIIRKTNAPEIISLFSEELADIVPVG